ncbi:MAG: serine hydrolase [Bacteroidia bacterium]|nr:serine hydrolase [Bacteroidia bacterium]
MYQAFGPTRQLSWLLLLLLGPFPESISAQESPGFADTRSRLVSLHIDRLATDWLETQGVPGLVVALVKGGRPLLVRGYGLADVTSGVPMDPERTLIHASSLATPLTASAVLQLVDAGLLDLGADADSYLKGWRIPATFPEPVTIEQLLVHTAGFDSRIIARQVHHPEKLLPLEDYLAARMPPRVRPPGEISIYSEHGYALAGLLIEEVSGSAFATYMRRNVFLPLGMRHSSFDWNRQLEDSLATGYGLVGTNLEPVGRDLRQTIPASMLATTASDAAHWMLALLNEGALEGKRILSGETTSLMLSRQFTHHPSIAGRSLGLREGNRYEPGEFFQVGSSSGFSSAVVLVPGRRLGLFVAANSRTSIWGLIDAVLQPFVGRAPVGEPSEPGSHTDSAAGMAGFYREADIPQTSIEKLATLIRQDRLLEAPGGDLVWRSHRFSPADQPLLLRDTDSGEPLALVSSTAGTRYLAFSWGLMESVSWFHSRPVQLVLWILFAAIFMAASAWPTGRFPQDQAELIPTDSFRPRWPLYCAGLAALFNLSFLVTLAATLAWALGEGAQSLAFGVPPIVRLVLCLPLVGAALTVPALLGVARAWQKRSWTFSYRLRLTLTVAVLLLFLPFLHTWNLLGFRF